MQKKKDSEDDGCSMEDRMDSEKRRWMQDRLEAGQYGAGHEVYGLKGCYENEVARQAMPKQPHPKTPMTS